MSGALDLPTLVLNRQWTPVHVTSVRHALALLFTDRAHVVCPIYYEVSDFSAWRSRAIKDGHPRVRGISFDIEAPEVIVLRGYDRLPPLGVVFNRRNLYRRDENACQYCGARLAPERLTIDHVLPVSRGGRTEWENCVLACHRCNGRKANHTPPEARMKLLRTPVRPEWSPRYAIYARDNRPKSWDRFLPRTRLAAAGAGD